MASTSSSPLEAPAPPTPNWLGLPEEVTLSILRRLEATEILEVVQKVCKTWRKICSDPSMWRTIDFGNIWWDFPDDVEKICKQAVDRSRGELREISLGCFATDELLHYIVDRAPQLRSLQLAYCSIGFEIFEVPKKLPNLEELHMYLIPSCKEVFENIGRCCPQLKSLTYNIDDYNPNGDEEAVAIAQTMPGLRHLSLFGNQMTNVGLQAILNGCPHLESLDLRQCYYIDLEGALGKTCAQQIKNLRWPDDSIDGYEYKDCWLSNSAPYIDLPWFYSHYEPDSTLERKPVEILESHEHLVRGRPFLLMKVRCQGSRDFWDSDVRLRKKYPELFKTQA